MNHIKYIFWTQLHLSLCRAVFMEFNNGIKLHKLQSFLPCTDLVHLLYNLNFDSIWLRYCKTVYNHYKNIFTFLPNHLRNTPGSNKINFITCLSGHKRNKTLSFLCQYYTTMLKQNICSASPFLCFLVVFLVCFEIFIFHTITSTQRVINRWNYPSTHPKNLKEIEASSFAYYAKLFLFGS